MFQSPISDQWIYLGDVCPVTPPDYHSCLGMFTLVNYSVLSVLSFLLLFEKGWVVERVGSSQVLYLGCWNLRTSEGICFRILRRFYDLYRGLLPRWLENSLVWVVFPLNLILILVGILPTISGGRSTSLIQKYILVKYTSESSG